MAHDRSNSQIKRPSHYNIYVPVTERELYLLVHGYTGALDLVDVSLAQCLMESADTNHPLLPCHLDTETLEYLEQRGYVTDMNTEDEIAFVHDLAKELHNDLENSAPKFYIMPSYNCQLRCAYCFECQVRNKAEQDGWLGHIMTEDIIEAAFRAIDQINTDKTKQSITLYGGEPLMRRNRDCINKIIEAGCERKYNFLAATNGVDLDAYLDLLSPDKIAAIQVPVDGIPATHNKLRHYADGQPTFERIIQNIKAALDRNIYVKIRVNTTRDVLEHLDEFVALMDQIGLLESPRFSCYFKAVFPSTRLTHKQLKLRGYVSEAEVAERLSRYSEFGNVLTGYPVTDSRVRALFESEILNAISPVHCGAMSNIYILDPFGRIYPCNSVVGDAQNCIGIFSPKLKWNEEIIRKWHNRSIENMSECLRCRYAFLCSGGCAYRALVDFGEISSPHCDNFAHTFENFILGYCNQYCDN